MNGVNSKVSNRDNRHELLATKEPEEHDSLQQPRIQSIQ